MKLLALNQDSRQSDGRCELKKGLMFEVIESPLILFCLLWIAVVSLGKLLRGRALPAPNAPKDAALRETSKTAIDNGQLPSVSEIGANAAILEADYERLRGELHRKLEPVQPHLEQESNSKQATSDSIHDKQASELHKLLLRRVQSLHDSLDPVSFRPTYNLALEIKRDLPPITQPPVFDYTRFEDYSKLQRLYYDIGGPDLPWKTGYLDLRTEASLLGMYLSWTSIQRKKCMGMSGVQEYNMGPTAMTMEHAFFDGLYKELEVDIWMVYEDERELDEMFGKTAEERGRMWEAMKMELKSLRDAK